MTLPPPLFLVVPRIVAFSPFLKATRRDPPPFFPGPDFLRREWKNFFSLLFSCKEVRCLPSNTPFLPWQSASPFFSPFFFFLRREGRNPFSLFFLQNSVRLVEIEHVFPFSKTTTLSPSLPPPFVPGRGDHQPRHVLLLFFPQERGALCFHFSFPMKASRRVDFFSFFSGRNSFKVGFFSRPLSRFRLLFNRSSVRRASAGGFLFFFSPLFPVMVTEGDTLSSCSSPPDALPLSLFFLSVSEVPVPFS